MHHPVAYGVDFLVALDHTLFRVGENVEHVLHCLLMVGHADGDCLLRPVGTLEFQERVGETDLLHAAFSEDVAVFRLDELILHAAASAVENQYLHFICLMS